MSGFIIPHAGLVQVAAALSALESVAGAVRVHRFDHSSLGDPTDVNTLLYKMEYIVHFHELARPADLNPLTFTADSNGGCGKTVVPSATCCLHISKLVHNRDTSSLQYVGRTIDWRCSLHQSMPWSYC